MGSVRVRLRDYQQAAVDSAATILADTGRAVVVLPCGTGKTIVGQHIARAAGDRIVLFAPTIDLVEQTLSSWRRLDQDLHTIAVHSGRAEIDGNPDVLADTAHVTTTDPKALAEAINAAPGPLLVACTYASAERLAEAYAAHGAAAFDVVVLDEAHRTVGQPDRAWSVPLNDVAIPAPRRLALTATPKTIEVPADERDELVVTDMSDEDAYGPIVAPMTFRQAIDRGWLSDYRIVVVAVHDPKTAADVARRAAYRVAETATVQSRWLPGQLAVLDVMGKYGARSVLAFANRITHSEEWASSMRDLIDVLPEDDRPAGEGRVVHIDGTDTATTKRRALDVLAAADDSQWGIVSQCRLFGEGIDSPALDAVVFVEPRGSAIDIVQSVGRAMRPHPHRADSKATIILPVPVAAAHLDNAAYLTISSAWRGTQQVLAALADQDNVLFEAMLSIRRGRDVADFDDLLVLDTGVINDPAITAAWRAAFTSHVIERLTPAEVDLLPVVTQFAARHGHTRIPASWRGKNDRPYGRQIAQLRDDYLAGMVHPRVASKFEAIRGWQWEGPGADRDAAWRESLSLVAQTAEQAGGLPHVHGVTRVLASGATLRCGAWLMAQADRTLRTWQEQQMTRLLGAQWRDAAQPRWRAATARDTGAQRRW